LKLQGDFRGLFFSEKDAPYEAGNIVYDSRYLWYELIGHKEINSNYTIIYIVLVGKSGGNRPFGRRRRRWDNIKEDLKEIKSEGVDWVKFLAAFRYLVAIQLLWILFAHWI
jgi:hypothetical protein